MVFDAIMLDKLKNSDLVIHLKNGYDSAFNEYKDQKCVASGAFQFCTDKFICVCNNRIEDEKRKPFFILVNIDDIIAIEMVPHEAE
jgi:hypothetical protein